MSPDKKDGDGLFIWEHKCSPVDAIPSMGSDTQDGRLERGKGGRADPGEAWWDGCLVRWGATGHGVAGDRCLVGEAD